VKTYTTQNVLIVGQVSLAAAAAEDPGAVKIDIVCETHGRRLVLHDAEMVQTAREKVEIDHLVEVKSRERSSDPEI
jgi:hypothetical protein